MINSLLSYIKEFSLINLFSKQHEVKKHQHFIIRKERNNTGSVQKEQALFGSQPNFKVGENPLQEK